MSETLGARPDIATLINGEVRRRLVEALGELTLNNITNTVRGDVMTNQLAAAEKNFNDLAVEVEALRAEVASATEHATIPDVSKLDFDILVKELAHRGYVVVASEGDTSGELRRGGFRPVSQFHPVTDDLPQDAQPVV